MKKKRKNPRNLSSKTEQSSRFDDIGFLKSCEDLIGLCNIISLQNETNQTLLRNFIKIRLVSIVEFNLKGMIADLIDDYDLDPTELLTDDTIAIDLDFLQNFKSDEYTKGRIIVAYLDKMNPGNIKRMLSRINHLESFEWFDKIRKHHSGDLFEFFNLLNKERNDLTHNLKNTDDSVEILVKTITKIKDNIFGLYICTNCNLDMFDRNRSENFLENEYGGSLKKLSLNQKEFRDITKKFRKEYRPSYRKY